MTVHIELSPDHPGFRDPEYRQRRDAIATFAERWRPGQPLPEAPYTEAEHAVWRELWGELCAVHDERVSQPLLECERRLDLPANRIPQLSEVEAKLVATTGFRLEPVTGLVPARRFLERLADGYFLSTQYVRHQSRPRYTPEPDVIHELVGHAGSLAHPGIAQLSRHFGRVARAVDDDQLLRLIRVYWFTLEFGLCMDGDALRAVGAGLLSSVGELSGIEDGPQLCGWDLNAIADTPFDTTRMQEQLFVAPSFERMLGDLETWLDGEHRRASASTP